MIGKRQWMRRALGSAVLLTLPVFALGRTAPVLDRTVKIVVGFTPGGSADLVARALARQLSGYSATVIVENKPGAGGRIAADYVKDARPDGTTLLVTPSSTMTLYPHIYKNLGYDPIKAFAPAAMVASFPYVLVVGPLVPPSVKTVSAFLAWAKAHPRQASFASPGNGTGPGFAGIALSRAAHVGLTDVAYKGGAPAMNDVVAGQIAANMAVISNAIPFILAGKVRALAVTGPARSKALAQVPTMAEAGFPDVTFTESFGVYLPAKTPIDVVNKLNKLVEHAIASKQFQEMLASVSFDAALPMKPPEYKRRIEAETASWGKLVKATGFTPAN